MRTLLQVTVIVHGDDDDFGDDGNHDNESNWTSNNASVNDEIPIDHSCSVHNDVVLKDAMLKDMQNQIQDLKAQLLQHHEGKKEKKKRRHQKRKSVCEDIPVVEQNEKKGKKKGKKTSNQQKAMELAFDSFQNKHLLETERMRYTDLIEAERRRNAQLLFEKKRTDWFKAVHSFSDD
jgi:hypothetical protein